MFQNCKWITILGFLFSNHIHYVIGEKNYIRSHISQLQDGIYKSSNGPLIVKHSNNIVGKCYLEECANDSIFDHSLMSQLLNEFVLNDWSDNNDIAVPDFDTEQCITICQNMMESLMKHSDTLFVFTTCNHLEMSVRSLESLQQSSDSFDIVVVDDHSIDGTVDYLIKHVS
jgi:hypothetical protein